MNAFDSPWSDLHVAYSDDYVRFICDLCEPVTEPTRCEHEVFRFTDDLAVCTVGVNDVSDFLREFALAEA